MKEANEIKNLVLVKRIYLFVAIAIIILFIQASQIFFLALAGYIFFLFLNSIANWLAKNTPVAYSPALTLTLLFLFLLFIGYWVYLMPVFSDQFGQFLEKIPELKSRLIELLDSYISRETLKENLSVEKFKDLGFSQSALSQLNNVLGNLLYGLTSLLIVAIIGIYFSVNPSHYRKILVTALPPSLRQQANQVLQNISESLSWWLVGRLASMAIVGLLSTVGLWILGVDLAMSLGIFAAMVSFIPNLGPIISLVPAALMGLIQSPITALYVVALYLGIQTVESYLITPFITEKVVSLPPAWLIFFQLVVSMIFGIAGLAMAAPTLVLLTVLYRQIFLKIILGDDSIESLV